MARKVEYYGYSADGERFLGTLDYPDDGSYHGKLFAEWEQSFEEEIIYFTYWNGKWFKGVEGSNSMTSLTIDDLPKDLQMKMLVGAV